MIEVNSEIGRLRRVLVHKPGAEIDRMIPALMDELLFDDILFGEVARHEHERFTSILEAAGVEVLDAIDLLGDVLEAPAARAAALAALEEIYGVPSELIPVFEDQDADDLAEALVGGVLVGGVRQRRHRSIFDLPPLPNYFFQRDPQFVLGRRVVISSMATDAREREPFLARMLFGHHPELETSEPMMVIEPPTSMRPTFDPGFCYPTIEGGDVLVPYEDTVLVGISERTNKRGARVLAEHLRSAGSEFAHMVLVEIPRSRSYMHLDTVFTFIDEDTCLAYEPVIVAKGHQTASAYRIDLTSDDLDMTMHRSLPHALAAAGHEIDVVPCGGSDDLIAQAREQWTDGANAFAIAPGVILLYQRNRQTVAELKRRGWRVITDVDVLEKEVPVLGQGPTVVTLPDNELSRARGGPRCMTMPLKRDALD
jgi:arginine deiminase